MDGEEYVRWLLNRTAELRGQERVRLRDEARGASLRGLRRFCLFVEPEYSNVPVYRDRGWNRFIVTDLETDRLITELHEQRMEIVRAAFPVIESNILALGVELIHLGEWYQAPRLPRLVLSINLGEPNQGASFSASLRLEQQVLMARDPSVQLIVKTWEGRTVKHPFKDDGVERVLEAAVSDFHYYYRIVNGPEFGGTGREK